MIEKAFAQMGEIPVSMPRRSNPLVDLNDMNRGPRHVRGRERAQHDPGRMAAADSEDETSACGNLANRAFGFNTANVSYTATDTVAAWAGSGGC